MSRFYKQKNNETTARLFNRRVNYIQNPSLKNAPNIVDFTALGEKYMYGRVYRDMSPMCLRRKTIQDRFAALPYRSPSTNKSLSNLNFAVAIFNEMAQQFQKAIQLKKIYDKDPHLSELRVHRAYESPYTAYNTYQKQFQQDFGNFMKTENIHFSNFNEFLNILMPTLRRMVRDVPFTFPAYIKSKECSVLSAGIAFEIADLNCANDQLKIQQFVNSPNWDFYVNACNSYGFMIDLNIPWRIVLDLNAPEVKEIARRYGYTGLNNLFSTAYTPPAINQIRDLIPMLYRMYEAARVDSYTIMEECGTKEVPRTIFPTIYNSANEIYGILGINRILEIYILLRLYEEKPDLSESEIKRLVNDTITMVNDFNNLIPITHFFEAIINKEFDKIGSNDYNIKANRAKAQMREGPQAVTPSLQEVFSAPLSSYGE